MSYLRHLCLFAHSGGQHILGCIFGLLVFVLCTLCCQFLWVVHFWLPLRYSGACIYATHKISLPYLITLEWWHIIHVYVTVVSCRYIMNLKYLRHFRYRSTQTNAHSWRFALFDSYLRNNLYGWHKIKLNLVSNKYLHHFRYCRSQTTQVKKCIYTAFNKYLHHFPYNGPG